MMTTALHKRYPGNKHLLSEFKLSIRMGIRTISRVYRKRHGLSTTWLPVHVSYQCDKWQYITWKQHTKFPLL